MNHDPIHHLAEILLRGGVLLPACLLVALVLRRGSASLIRRFWRCALFALLVASALTLTPPLLTFTSNSTFWPSINPASGGGAPSPSTETVNGTPAASLESVLGVPEVTRSTPPPLPNSITPPSSSPLTFPLVLAALWLLGAVLFAARKLVGTIGVHRLRCAATPVDHEGWQSDLADRLVATDTGEAL